jgi:predicted flap endonuclease-1-like 5' DNA nuclease
MTAGLPQTTITPMELRSLWFLLAGFILGFAVSLLWEWLYFRQVRWRALSQAIPDSPPPTEPTDFAASQESDGNVDIWSAPAYRSPNVLLEGEEPVEAAEPTLRFEQAERDQRLQRATRHEFVAVRPAATFAAPTIANEPPVVHTEALFPPVHPTSMVATSASPVPDADEFSDAPPEKSISSPSPIAIGQPTGSMPIGVTQLTATAVSPTTVTAPPIGVGSQADDLTKIRGIGNTYAKRLQEGGICTWEQLASTETETLRVITKAMPYVNIEDWRKQAEQLAHGAGAQS